MYTIFNSGSKQYLASVNQTIRVEKLIFPVGDIIEINQIIMITNSTGTRFGNPFIKNGKILAEIITHGKQKKVTIIKFNRRKHFQKKQGHRQWFTDIKIIKIIS